MGQIFESIAVFALDSESPDKVVVPESWLDGVKKWCVWLCVLGAGILVFASVNTVLWVWGGEERARRAREKVFGTLMGRGVGWFENRGEGVGALVEGVERYVLFLFRFHNSNPLGDRKY